MYQCSNLKVISLPNVEIIDNFCFAECIDIENLYLPKLKEMGSSSFRDTKLLQKIYLPELKTIRYNCFNYFEEIGYLDLPKLEVITEFCFACCDIKRINVPSLNAVNNAKINKTIKRQNFRLMPKRLVDKFKKLLRGEEKGKCKIYK